MTWVCVSRQGAPNISVGLDAGGRETCCAYSLCGWDHVDLRMLNLVLSSVAALFISCPRQAKAWLLGVSEKTELMLRVSGGSDESCCAHWLLVFWAPTVEKDNERKKVKDYFACHHPPRKPAAMRTLSHGFSCHDPMQLLYEKPGTQGQGHPQAFHGSESLPWDALGAASLGTLTEHSQHSIQDQSCSR